MCIKDAADHFDATLVVWQDRDVGAAALSLLALHRPERYRKLRVEKLWKPDFVVENMAYFDDDILRTHAFVDVNPQADSIFAWNPETNTYYYSVSKLDPEEFVKHGHIFILTFSKILKTPISNLAHGAVVGLQDKGVLLCGFGYRGKSTFSMSALMDGFDYVTDDYLVLGMDGDVLRAWPIYSIITLSPNVYQAMQSRLHAKFVSNNGRKDKYVFNIGSYQGQFRSAYPVKMCMYPVFTSDDEPSIFPGDKEKAVHELVMSTLQQMGDAEDVITISKMYGFVQNLPFYRFNLTKNIDKNTRCLRGFLERY